MDLERSHDLEQLRKIIGAAGKLKMPVLMDGNLLESEVLKMILHVTRKELDTKIIIAHALFTNFRKVGTLSSEPELTQNLYVDISAAVNYFEDSPEKDVLVWNLRKFGIPRVFFGSDYPVHTPKAALEAFKTYPFTDAEKTAILGENLRSFLKR